MVQLDTQLILDGVRFSTGANVHRIKEWIFYYEEAVRQSQEGRPYRPRFEKLLRSFVVRETKRRNFSEARALY